MLLCVISNIKSAHAVPYSIVPMEHGITEQQEGSGESGDAGIFEITDFTNATQWERYSPSLLEC